MGVVIMREMVMIIVLLFFCYNNVLRLIVTKWKK